MKNNNLKISVIITTLNEGKRLYKTINSYHKKFSLIDIQLTAEDDELTRKRTNKGKRERRHFRYFAKEISKENEWSF